MKGEPTIRRAAPTDALGIGRVHVAAWRDTYPGVLPAGYLVGMSARAEAARWRTTQARSEFGTATFVAEDPSAGIIGYGICGPQRNERPAGIDGEFYALYVRPQMQGRNIGRQLIAAMADHLLACRMSSASVWVLRDNPSRWFYQRLGGRLAAEEMIRFAGIQLVQLAYVWPNFSALDRLARSVGRAA